MHVLMCAYDVTFPVCVLMSLRMCTSGVLLCEMFVSER